MRDVGANISAGRKALGRARKRTLNRVRPFLIGVDTKLPDYVVLISTLGGIAIFGLNGFVIGPVIAAMFIATWDSNRELEKGQR
jgi:predicted PurR-regulated permease PerM